MGIPISDRLRKLQLTYDLCSPAEAGLGGAYILWIPMNYSWMSQNDLVVIKDDLLRNEFRRFQVLSVRNYPSVDCGIQTFM